MLSGIYINYFNKDFSKNNGFIFLGGFSYKKLTPIIHIIVGILLGVCIYNGNYWYEKDKKTKKVNKNLVRIRKAIGIIIFVSFTARNIYKHPTNLAKKIRTCSQNISNIEKYLLSSITRQQLQLIIGIIISKIIFNRDDQNNFVRSSLIGITFIQTILHILFTFKNNYSTRKLNLLDCLHKDK